MMQNNTQQNLTASAPLPTDDDFSIPELTIKDSSGQSQKVVLTTAPAPASDEVNDEQKKLNEFRDKASSVMGNDASEDIVLADLAARAKADALKNVPAPDAKVVNQKINTALENLDSLLPAEDKAVTTIDLNDSDDIFISLDDFQEEIATLQSKQQNQREKTVAEKIAAKIMEEKEPVLANPVASQNATMAPPVIIPINKMEDELVPEIDLDTEDSFTEKTSDLVDTSTDKLAKVEVKSKQELSRGAAPRVAVVQNIMKTESIYDRNKKPEKAKRGLFSGESSVSRTLSPVEELQMISLEEWRRLGDIPEERMSKIKEKIEILGEKGILSQIKGLNAWRRSPIMQHYLDLGIKALLDAKGVEEYIETLNDDENITFAEWLAINKLNSQLMI